jgi:hypothetical protein
MGQGVSKVLVGIVVSLPVVYLSAMLVVAWRTVRDIQRRVAAAVKSD